MRISSIPSYNSNYYSNKPSFKGMTEIMERKVMALDYKRAQKLVDMSEKPSLLVGYFPKDIFEVLKSQSLSSEDLRAKIKTFNDALTYQAQ